LRTAITRDKPRRAPASGAGVDIAALFLHPPGVRFGAALLLSTAGCTLEPIDATDKSCPCAPGYECDPATMRCVSTSTPGCEPAVTVSDFRAVWATPNVIRWEWQPGGDLTQLVGYEIHVELVRTGQVTVYDRTQNPELGDDVLPRAGGGAEDLVTSTMTSGHAPDETYAGQLVAIDSSLCEFRSPIAAASTTLDLPEEIVLFRDASSVGSPFPGTIRVVPDGPDAYLEHVPSMDMECVASGEDVCSQQLRWQGFSVSLSDISQGEFDRVAILEIRMANEGSSPSFFSNTWIQLDDGRFFRLQPFTIAPGPRTIQVPLRALANDGTELTHGDIADPRNPRHVTEVDVGGQWSRCAPGEAMPCTNGRVIIDDASIRH
jgi:hypothetical protein